MANINNIKNFGLTLAIIKPHAFKNTYILNNINNIIYKNFNVIKSKEIIFTNEISSLFYKEHKDKFFYNRLVTFMSSGPSLALILASSNPINKWRALLGPTKVFKAIYIEPNSIRGLYGLTDTRNVCHGSDGDKSAKYEIQIIFPEFCFETWKEKYFNE